MKQIRVDFQKDAGGIGYRINPDNRTYTSGGLKDGELIEPLKTGEYSDAQKFASQLYYLILASLNEMPSNSTQAGQ